MTPERYKRLTTVLSHRQPDLTVVLENVFDPHNVSAVMRTCDAVGIQEIYILNNRLLYTTSHKPLPRIFAKFLDLSHPAPLCHNE